MIDRQAYEKIESELSTFIRRHRQEYKEYNENVTFDDFKEQLIREVNNVIAKEKDRIYAHADDTPQEPQRAGTEKAEEVIDSRTKKARDITISPKGVEFIKAKEGFREAPYLDTVGVLTVGYGTSAPIYKELTGHELTPDVRVSQEKATELLIKFFEVYVYEELEKCNAGRLPQHTFDAVCSFLYNVGVGVLKTDIGVGWLKEIVFERYRELFGNTSEKVNNITTLRNAIDISDIELVALCMLGFMKPIELKGRRQKEVLLAVKGDY